MNIPELLNDKALKAKSKTEVLSSWLLENKISIDELIAFAKPAKDPIKATCIEAVEFATKQNPEIANTACFNFVTESLCSVAPRVKWESAKVIGNIAYLFAGEIDTTVRNLLTNAENKGTVVRWSAAFALGEILKLKTKLNKDLLPAIEALSKTETQNSIRKIYLDAIKKTG